MSQRTSVGEMKTHTTFCAMIVVVLSIVGLVSGNWIHPEDPILKNIKIVFPNPQTGADVITNILSKNDRSDISSMIDYGTSRDPSEKFFTSIGNSLLDGVTLVASVASIDNSQETNPELCPWVLGACPLNRFAVTFSVKPSKSISGDREVHILTLRLKSGIGDSEQRVLQLRLHQNSQLFVLWGSSDSTGQTFEALTEEHVQLAVNEWNAVMVQIKINTDEISSANWPPVNSSTDFLIKNILRETTATANSSLQRPRTKRSLESTLGEIPMNIIRKVKAMNFSKESFLRYDFRNRLIKNAPTETLTIDFEIPAGAEDGLIWFIENNSSKSYVYIKDSRLHYTYVFIDDQPGRAKLTLTEEIYLNTPLEPDLPQVLTLTRDKDNLTLTLNDRSHASKAIDGRVPLIPSDGQAYLGGSSHPAVDTNGKSMQSFQGRITKAEVTRFGDKRVDLLQVATDPHWQKSIEKQGEVGFEYQEPKVSMVIGPTASKPYWPLRRTTGDKTALTLLRDPTPIYFMGLQTSVVRFDTWDFKEHRSFEMEFTTYEPNGILFFVGPDREHTDFVCVELFDGNIYFVYAVGSHYRHVQLNDRMTKVNTGMANRIYVARDETHRFLVKFNDEVIDVDQGVDSHQTEFATYTYIGSVDQPSRLPWHVWSAENFAGCIASIRVNDDKFLNPRSRMSQHTDISRGVEFGKCHVVDKRCTRTICGGGQCSERSYPYYEPKNFACDCSGSDMTFRSDVEDIRRSESCNRNSPILEMDGEMVFLVNFETQSNTLTTHTDDISLQFKTMEYSTPLFYAVAPADKSYFRVDLVSGHIRVQTNINQLDDRFKYQEYSLNSPYLNDNQWHTLRIRRRAEYLDISIDGRYEFVGKIPLIDHTKTFKLVAQQIYLGAAGPSDYSRPPPPTSEAKFLPPPPRFVGELRNFYWNEFDFIGTGTVPSKYSTDILTPRAKLPVFPTWPRKPTYSITLTRQLHYGLLDKIIDIKDGGDMFLIEFRTEYEGVLLSAHESGVPNPSNITLVILNGKLYVIYSINGQTGMRQVVGGLASDKLDDGRWHRVVVGLDRRKKQMVAYLDSSTAEIIGDGVSLSKLANLKFYVGGLPDAEWRHLFSHIKVYSPTALQGSEAEHGKQPAFTGCVGGFSLRKDNFGTDLLKQYDWNLKAVPEKEIVREFCREQRRCHIKTCQRGRCDQVSDTEVRCICTGTGYEGPQCEIEIIDCPVGYCNQRGSCSMINGQPRCDCSGTGYYGERCEQNPCMTGSYCLNGGACTMRGNAPFCDCRGTKFRGDKCQDPICTFGYCQNRGRCQVDANNQPFCECQGTGFSGPRCEQPACSKDMCDNGGRCLVSVYGVPECNCAGTGFRGPRCQTPICTTASCDNRGRCVVGANDQPTCDCRGTSYRGDRCQTPICTEGYCENRGRCRVGPNELPSCDCTGTGFDGPRCTESLCRPGHCKNNGRCSVDLSGQPICKCEGTGFTGSNCQTPICPYNFCSNGGICRVTENGLPMCDCQFTEFQGEKCETPICSPAYCGGRGSCVVRQRQPTCNCHSGYRGARCEVEICPLNHCLNGGYCVPGPDMRPVCTCPVNYEGDRCQLSKVCPPDYCFHGGRCTMGMGIPRCDCLGTDYTGQRCETPETCPMRICQNGGRCSVQGGNYVCDCAGTGFRGHTCTEPEACPPNHCLYGGVCTVLPGNRFSCDCSKTGRGGEHCKDGTPGIYVGYDREGYLIYNLIPSVQTIEDNVTLGFRTYMQSGSLITFLTSDGKYWALKLRDGRAMVDIDGKNFYAFRTRSNDGHYHVINVERKGDTMIVTQDSEVIRVHLPILVNPLDKSVRYNAIHVAADEKKKDVFRGVIGGVYWNGRYPIRDLKEGRVHHTGEVTIVLVPDFTISPPKPQPVCLADYCLNGGYCYAEDYQLKCDCINTGWNGVRCERQSRGYIPAERGNRVYVIYTFNPPNRTTTDVLRVAFQTWAPDGPIVRVVQDDKTFFDIILLGGKLMASFNGLQHVPIVTSRNRLNDGQMHVISVRRNEGRFNFTVDGSATFAEPSKFVGSDGSFVTREIVLGADRQLNRTFDGVIGGFYWNGRYLIDDRGTIVTDALVMAAPGRRPAGMMEEVVVVLMPHLLTPSSTVDPESLKPIPGVDAGTGLMLKQAGGILGMGGLVDAFLAGLLLALLLLISALIWACWRCKPGCCAFCYGKSGARRRDSAWNRVVAACCAQPSGTGKETVGLLENGVDVTDTIAPTTYPLTARPDLQPGIDSPLNTAVQLEQPLLTTDQNIYNIDGLKVDCVLITKNSKYFVTGSGMGPPKVWDAQTGEVYKVMEGNELGCTDLHLACDDSVLVTQVVDDLGGGLDTLTDANAIRVKRLQLWDFASCHQLEMPVEVMCTASCLTRKSEHVIVARSSRNGPSILAWNLPANQIDREIFYESGSPMLRDSLISYLNISHDDRLIVAGYKIDEQARYMVFDLAANYSGPAQPRIFVSDAEVNATEIIGRETAITGTRKGELLVWNLHTGEEIRQILINATLEGGNLTVLPPHTGIIHCVKLSEDEHYLVTGAQDQLVRVWTMPDERLLHTLEGHADDVLSVAISRDSEIVVSGSWDGSIRVWRLRDGNQICWFSSNIEILQVKISNDKQSLVALGERNDHRKLITLRVVRKHVRTTTSVRPAGSRILSPMSPPTPGMAPSSPNIMA